MRRGQILILQLLLLQLFLSSPSLLRAQTLPPAAPQTNDDDPDDADEKTPPLLSVNVTFDTSGKLTVIATSFESPQPTFSDLKMAIQESLGCPLTDRPRSKFSSNYYAGSCTGSSAHNPLLRQGRVDTAPLRAYCQNHGIERLALGLQFPQADLIESIPPAPSPATPGLTGKNAEWFKKFTRFNSSYIWPVDGAIPSQIQYRFGFDSASIRRGAIYLALALFAPLLLCFWLGRKALSAQTDDKAVVWFSYMRCLQWTLNGALVAWWVALDASNLQKVLEFVMRSTRFAHIWDFPGTYEVVSWLPPSIVWVLCLHLSHPVQQKLRGLQWTRRELSLQSLYSVLIGLFPFALFLTGLRVMGTGTIRAGLYWFVAAVLLRVFAAKGLLRITGMQPQALTSGTLRDHAFEMAEKLGVKLQQVFLIPSGKGQMANAFARTGNTISFTDFLLQRMSAREVDYVMAHELTHLKLKHPAKLGYAYLGGYFLGTFLIPFLPSFFAEQLIFRYAVIFAGLTIFPYFFSRRFEYAADAGAVALTGDPRAAIAALFKLSELNMMPTQWSHWSEKWLTHPSSMRRARAIAQKAGIAFEEIPTIVREAAADAPAYASPAAVAPSNKIHSSQYKRSVVSKLTWSLVATLTIVPCLFGLLAIRLGAFHSLQIAVLIAGIPGAFAAFFLLHNFVPRITHGNLVAPLNKKFSNDGVLVGEWGGIHVGFAPSAAPRTFEGTYNWDLGYLFLRSDRICFWGEETQFALLREQITAIKLAPGAAGFRPVKRIFIAWTDSERSTCGVFNIGCRMPATVTRAKAKATELAQRIQIWWQTPASVRPLPPLLAALHSPEPRSVTSAIPGSVLKGAKMLKELFVMGLLAAITAVLFGLPFHLIAFLTSSTYSGLGLPVFHSPGAGWYAVILAVLVRWLIVIPVLRYKDQPVLVAKAPTPNPVQTAVTVPSTANPVTVP
jgi:Zn-dependent protease with chaperone function